MQIKRAASIPLITHDPYFSVWAPADRLYDEDPIHWSGIRQQMRGYVNIDGEVFCFMGDREFHKEIEQKSVDVTATATEYFFENDKIGLKVRFTSPLLLDDRTLVSRPCTYVDLEVDKKTECEVSADLFLSAELAQRTPDALVGGQNERKKTEKSAAFGYAFLGRARQQPLGSSGDNLTIDWGYGYVAAERKENEEPTVLCYDKKNRCLRAHMSWRQESGEKSLILAYDDLLSIQYFGEWRKAYWTQAYATILDAIGAAFLDKQEVCKRAAALDQKIGEKAKEIGGEEYAFLCHLSYRQSVSAHKLITDETGNLIFLSKENDSNGCIGTVDVSYPSVPLFLLYDAEYVKGMLRPIFRFARCDVWEYDFAPHDVGRYPYAWGQVYGLNRGNDKGDFSGENGDVFPPFYQYPKGSGVFCLNEQMPLEECGNMLLMTALVCKKDGSAEFAVPFRGLLRQWAEYLAAFGAEPGEQLCTDDFAGHLSQNVNLSVKAIMGIEAFSILLQMMGEAEEAARYHGIAADMAAGWEKKAAAGDHYMLAFGNPESWSLKYNLVWDRYFGSGLFSEEVYEKELAYYVKKCNAFGVPLDSRREYTKSDWILWCAAMAKDREQAEALIAPVARYLEQTGSRYPFSDWYETVTGDYCHFKGRSVQGGIFMPMLLQEK